MHLTPVQTTLLVIFLMALIVLLIFVESISFIFLAITLATILTTGFLIYCFTKDIIELKLFVENLQSNPNTPRPIITFRKVFSPLFNSIRKTIDNVTALDKKNANPGLVSPLELDRLPNPLLILDNTRLIIHANLAAHDMLGSSLVERDLAAVIRNPNVLLAVDDVLAGSRTTAEIEFDFTIPVKRNLGARISAINSENNNKFCAIISLYDITEIKRMESMRSDFIANISHELRTPISVLLGSLQTLRGHARGDTSAQEKFFELMEHQAKKMSHLVDDLLSLSRIEMNEHAAPNQIIDINEIINEIINTLSLAAEHKSINIKMTNLGKFKDIPGDRNDLLMAFQNLLDNAIKYSQENSEIVITATKINGRDLPFLSDRKRDYAAISIQDFGIGIDPEHIPRLTERFYRIDAKDSLQRGGTGLGLAIVKHAINRHRGFLDIKSMQGTGSIFTIYLPLEQENVPS